MLAYIEKPRLIEAFFIYISDTKKKQPSKMVASFKLFASKHMRFLIIVNIFSAFHMHVFACKNKKGK